MWGADMKRRPRLRRVAKWGGLTLSLLILLTWGASLVFAWEYWRLSPSHLITLDLDRGVLVTCWYDADVPTSESSFAVRYEFSRPSWRLRFEQGINRFVYIGLPLWIPFLLAALPTAFLFWRDRRTPPGHCQECGYDLTGNTSGVCSECGERINRTNA